MMDLSRQLHWKNNNILAFNLPQFNYELGPFFINLIDFPTDEILISNSNAWLISINL